MSYELHRPLRKGESTNMSNAHIMRALADMADGERRTPRLPTREACCITRSAILGVLHRHSRRTFNVTQILPRHARTTGRLTHHRHRLGRLAIALGMRWRLVDLIRHAATIFRRLEHFQAAAL